MVDGYLTPEAAATALYVVAEMTPKGAEALFKREADPTLSAKGRLPRPDAVGGLAAPARAAPGRHSTKTRRRASGAGRHG